MKIKAVIWDLDGTLLDTLSDLVVSVNAALEKNGFPPHAREELGAMVRKDMRSLMRRATPDGEENPRFEQVYADFLAHNAEHGTDLLAPYEGICALLDELNAMGVRQAIVSNKEESALRAMNRQYLGERISVVIGDKPPREKKPSPDGVYEAMRLLGCSRDEVIYVGDAQVDLHTAQNAGIPCVSVTWGFRTEASLREAGAQHIARTAQELLEEIKAI